MDDKIPGLNEIPGSEPKAAPPAQPSPQPAANGAPAAASSFDFNQPTIVAVLYLVAPFVGVSGLVGLVLAYVWRSEKPDSWEATHYTYLIRGFWIWFGATVLGFLLLFVLIGLLVLVAAFAFIIVRAVMSIVRAQKHEPMPEPESWLI